MKKTSAVRPVVLSPETSKALRAWAKPLGLTPEREDEFLTAEGRTWLVSLTRNEIEEEYSRYIQQSKKTAPKHK
jgi:hypothetical protein